MTPDSEAAVWNGVSQHLLLNYSAPHGMMKWGRGEALSFILHSWKSHTGKWRPAPTWSRGHWNVCQVGTHDAYGGAGPALAGKGCRAEWGCSEKKDLKILRCRLPSSPAQLPKPQHQSHPCLQSPRLSPQQGWAWGKSIEASVWLSSRQWWSWSMAVNLRLTNNRSSYNFQLVSAELYRFFLK